MSVLHRYDSEERQHYLFQPQYSLKIKPKLLYAGKLETTYEDGWLQFEVGDIDNPAAYYLIVKE